MYVIPRSLIPACVSHRYPAIGVTDIQVNGTYSAPPRTLSLETLFRPVPLLSEYTKEDHCIRGATPPAGSARSRTERFSWPLCSFGGARPAPP